jgi:hypothetical protein
MERQNIDRPTPCFLLETASTAKENGQANIAQERK